MANYYAFRLMLSQPAQLDAFEPEMSKRELLELAIDKIQKSYQLAFQAKGKRYLVYYQIEINTGTHALQIAREDTVLEPKAGERGVTNQPDIVYPYSYFIVDVSRNIILIQEKFSAFRDIDSIVSRVKDFFEKSLELYRVTVAMETISNAEGLWAEIESAQEIYSLVMDIDPPNFFGSRFRSNIDIREIHDETNFMKFKLILSNKLGSLRLRREEFDELIRTISSGAGSFIVKMRDRFGNMSTIGNSSRPKSVELPEAPLDIQPEVLEEEIDQIDNLNNNRPLS